MPRIIIAPDSFKESLSSPQVASAISRGIKRFLPDAELIEKPMADGGEGLAECLFSALGGSRHHCQVTDPLGQPVLAEWVSLTDGTAIIEMAAASGLALVPSSLRNPLTATSYGTGELIRAALEAGSARIIVGVGGSATSDGGIGMAQALGVRFLNSAGEILPPGVHNLSNLETVDVSDIHPSIKETEFIAACDVTNPLCGPQGAAAVYGPQKGATPDIITILDTAMSHLAQVVTRNLDIDLASASGAGGGGGMGYGLLAFTGAKITSGLDLVCKMTGFDQLLAEGADLVITGEGQINEQSLYGKVPTGIAARAQHYNIPVLAVVGSIVLSAETAAERGIGGLASIAPGPISLDECMARAPELLADAAERAVRMIFLHR
ncbi:MAG: glycerate kinase [Methylocystaceae bacterium]